MAKIKKSKLNVKSVNKNEMAELKAKMKQLVDDSEYVEAMDVMAEMASRNMMDADIMYMGAYCYMMTGDNERSVKWVNNVLRQDANNVKARILLARICVMEDHNEDALAVFEFIVKNLQNKLTDDDKEELEELLDYYRYSEADMLSEKYPYLAEYLGLEVVKSTENTVEETTEEVQDDPAERAKAAVARLRALLNSKKEEDKKMQEECCKEEQNEEVDIPEEKEEISEEAAFDVEGVSAQIMSKQISVKEKIKLFNSFAAGCYMNADYQSAFDLLSGALVLDAEDPTVLKNIAYVCAAAGEKEQAMEFASKMPMIDFGLLQTIK